MPKRPLRRPVGTPEALDSLVGSIRGFDLPSLPHRFFVERALAQLTRCAVVEFNRGGLVAERPHAVLPR